MSRFGKEEGSDGAAAGVGAAEGDASFAASCIVEACRMDSDVAVSDAVPIADRWHRSEGVAVDNRDAA